MRRRTLLATAATLAGSGCTVGHGTTADTRLQATASEYLITLAHLPAGWRETPPTEPLAERPGAAALTEAESAARSLFDGGPNAARLECTVWLFADAEAATTAHRDSLDVLTGLERSTQTVDVGTEATVYHPIQDWMLVQFSHRNAIGRVVYDNHASLAVALKHARTLFGNLA